MMMMILENFSLKTIQCRPKLQKQKIVFLEIFALISTDRLESLLNREAAPRTQRPFPRIPAPVLTPSLTTCFPLGLYTHPYHLLSPSLLFPSLSLFFFKALPFLIFIFHKSFLPSTYLALLKSPSYVFGIVSFPDLFLEFFDFGGSSRESRDFLFNCI